MALDSAHEVDDDQAAATALGYTAQLAHAEGMTTAAMDHLDAALAHAERASAVAPWLPSIRATIHGDSGDHAAAVDALHRAEPTSFQPATHSLLLFDYGPVHLCLPWPAAFISKPVTTPRPEPRWLSRSINSRPPPAAPASSPLSISP